MPKVTGPIAACIAEGQSRVFYVDDDESYVHYLTNDEDYDAERIRAPGKTRINYRDKTIRINDDDIKSATKDIAAVSFPGPNNVLRTRVVYTNPDGYLANLNKDGNDGWTFGSLHDKKYKAVKDAPITATHSPASDSLKIFYHRDGGEKVQNAPWVAWYNYKTKAWNTEPLISVS
ncbi:hypothetical protein ACN47E_007293 [Coniothyrium glycines]